MNTAEGIRTICKDKGGFLKAPWYDRAGPGLLSMADPKKHAKRRRLLASPLSVTSLGQFEPLASAKISLAMKKMKEENEKLGYADIYKWFGLMTTDIIGDLTFGSSFRMLEQGRAGKIILKV